MNLCLDNAQREIVEWVRRRVPYVDDFGPATALGVVDRQGKPMAGAVYHEYHPNYGTIMISLAADTARWATPRNIRAFLAYPFEELKVHKLRAAVAHTNERSLRLTKGVGFTQEGILVDEFGPGIHAVMFRMKDHVFYKRYGHVQRQQQAA